jgi:glycosyltransferase involved in cell wall biosynthesis
MIEGWLAVITDAIICVSRFEYDTAKSSGIPSAKLFVISNEIDIVPHAATIRPYMFDGDAVNVVYAGRFDYAKGFDILLEAMKRIQGSKIKLIAVGDEVNGDLDLKRADGVTYAGWLDREEIGRYLESADVIVVPSRWEAFGLTVVEAMAHGKAVVASNVGGIPELVEHGVTGFLFESGDVSTLAALLANTPKDVWLKMGTAGKQMFFRRFERGKCARETHNLYKLLKRGDRNCADLDAPLAAE